LNLIEGLTTIGVKDILVVLPVEGKICEHFKKQSIEVAIIPFVNETYYPGEDPSIFKKAAKFLYNWYIVLKYTKNLKRNRNTIIHSNSSATFIGAYFSLWLRVPHVWHLREFGFDDYKLTYNFGYKYFNYWMNKAQAVVAISKAIFNRRVKHTKARHKEIIYNGVISVHQLLNRSSNVPDVSRLQNDKITFGIIGLINKEKGQENAIDAFNKFVQQHINAELIIAGTGINEYVDMLTEKVKQLRLQKHIKFIGFVENTNEFYLSINCLLMCSKHEAFGRVTIEAMSNAVPVIGYNNGGTPEIIEHAYNGLLYQNGETELTEMMNIVAKDRKLLYQMAQNALKTVKEKFTIEAYAEKVYKTYKSL